ncbi:MAG TPA: iron ABC transporter permease, partial [Anaerolineae bacterium]|nr:iron ABC transporter permease [Anaerolineae bacterium]
MTTREGGGAAQPAAGSRRLPRGQAAGRAAWAALWQRPLLLLAGALVVVMAASLLVGRYPAAGVMSPSALWDDPLAQRLVLNLRLPRVLSACLLGMTLAGCGAVLQMIFRNPLVEPGFLGVSQGAAFGAALSIITLHAGALVTEVMAAGFAILGLALSYLIARRIRFGGWILRLVLAGIAVSALFSAGVGVLKYVADPLTELPDLIFWMLGGLWRVTWPDLLYLLPPVAVGLVVIMLMRWRLNLLSLDDDTGFSLGAAPGRERAIVLVAAVTATAAVVSVAGIVGWIGLLVPHVARRLTGADARRAVPASLLIGGLFAVVCDDLARTTLPGEIPLGILASLFGAMLFVGMMI